MSRVCEPLKPNCFSVGLAHYTNVGAVCSDCAKSAGFTPKRKVAGVWMDKCGICRKTKPCTDLHHDWRRKKGGAGK